VGQQKESQDKKEENHMRTLLNNANYLDVSKGRFVSEDLFIEGDRIVQIKKQIDGSQSDLVLDLKGYYVLPGLIDVHVHLCWDGSVDPVDTLEREPPELTILRMVSHARETVLSGVTTVRDLGAIDDLSFVLSTAIQRNIILGPRILATGKSLIITGGHDPFWGICVDGPWEAIKAVRRQVEKGAKVIKISATGGVYGREEREEVGQSEFTRGEVEAICNEAHRLGVRVASHALGKEGIENSVLGGCDTIEHGILASEEILRKMFERGTFLTPTLFIYKKIAEGNAPPYAKEKSKKVMEQHQRCFSEARRIGVKILAGSDAGSPEAPHPSLSLEMEEMVRLGMRPMEVIRIATFVNAQALEMENSIGSIREGKIADLFILYKDPSENLNELENIWGVLKGGALIRQGGFPIR
jgi:imidazolonepropionase-like amidohydrolase